MKKFITFFALSFLVSCGYTPKIEDNASKEAIIPEIATGVVNKPLVKSKKFMISSAHPLATQAGYDILARGGNAVDAAVAIQMALNVVEPQASGIGGGGFLVYYNAKTKKLISYDGRETAPMSTKETHFMKNGKPLDFDVAATGGSAVAVPGVLKMLELAQKEQGKLQWKDLFTSAINYADNGFPLSDRLHEMLKTATYYKKLSSDYQRYFNEKGELYPAGYTIYNKPLAESFKEISNNGSDVFYKGAIADTIVDAVKNSPHYSTILTKADLASYLPKKRNVPCIPYKKYELCAMAPPSSGGVTVMQALKILEPFKLENEQPYSTKSVHLIASALRLAYADRNKYLADPEFFPAPTEAMLTETYLTNRRSLISMSKAMPYVFAGDPSEPTIKYASLIKNEPPSTTHYSIIDSEGNAVSMTTTIERAFGSGLVTKSGFLLNNQMTDFDFIPEINDVPVANRPEAGKHPRSSMAPFIVFDENGEVKLVMGSPGGARIISYVLPRLISVLDWNMPLNEALEMPNIVAMSAKPDIEVETENHINQKADEIVLRLNKDLPKMGYKIISIPQTSGIHAVMRCGTELCGSADPRRTGSAKGL